MAVVVVLLLCCCAFFQEERTKTVRLPVTSTLFGSSFILSSEGGLNRECNITQKVPSLVAEFIASQDAAVVFETETLTLRVY